MRRVSAYSIVVNRHPVAPGRVVVHPLCSVQHNGRPVQCLSTAKTPRDTGDPVASDLLGVKLCEQLRDKHRESWSNLGMVHSPGSTFFASLPSPANSSFISLFAPTQRFCSSDRGELNCYAEPEEIALSVLSEIVIHRHRGTGDPMCSKLQDRAGRHLATEAATLRPAHCAGPGPTTQFRQWIKIVAIL